jgi:hypothetical protein
MNKAVINAVVDEYLRVHLHENAAAFMLKKHPFQNITNQELAQQLVGLQKAKNKFPDLFDNHHIVYPKKKFLEQTSSQITASYKSQLLSLSSMIDLTGGFGVDVSAFAKACPTTIHIEISSTLQAYAQQSFTAQGLQIKSVNADGLQYLSVHKDTYDLIYLDPSRKTQAHSKAIMLEDYEPNVIQFMDMLLQKGKKVMIKTSPMLDITAGLKQLGKVRCLHIVALKNEVKELLWILDKQASDPVELICVNLETEQPIFKTTLNVTTHDSYATPKKYLYEPNASIMKSQQFAALMQQYPVYKLDHDSHLFTANELVDFPGRIFKIIKVHNFKPKLIKKLYAGTARGVVTRNSKETVAQLRKKYNFKEHETDYLFFTSSKEVGAVVIEAVKLI